jgi:hypothetical protein
MPDLVYRILAQNLLKGELQSVKQDLVGVGTSAGALTGSTRNLTTGMHDTRDIANAVAATLRGDLSTAMASLTGLTNSQVAAFSKIGMAAGAAFAGWQLGSAIDQMFGISDAIARIITKSDDLGAGMRRASRA